MAGSRGGKSERGRGEEKEREGGGVGLIKAEFFGATAKNYNEERRESFGKRGVKLVALPCLPVMLGRRTRKLHSGVKK